MKPLRYTLLALLLAAAPALAAPPKMPRASDSPPAAKKACVPLAIAGDTQLVVKSLPCTVTAPAGADLYFWTLPSGVVGTSEENVLTVTAAPAGDSTIRVLAVTITITVGKDGAVTKVTKKEAGSVVLTNGSAPPAPPPPPPAPADPLTAALQAAYTADADPAKAANVKLLAALYRNSPTAPTATMATYADLFAQLSAARKVLMPDSAIPAVKKAAGDYLNSTLGTNAGAAIDPAKTGAAFGKLAAALEGVK